MWRPITRSEASLLFFPSNRANILSRRRLVKEPVHHPFETLFEKSPFSLEPRFIAGQKLRAPPSFVSFLPSPRIGGMARTRRNRTTIRVPIALEKRSSSRERISSTKLKIVKIVSVFFKLRFHDVSITSRSLSPSHNWRNPFCLWHYLRKGKSNNEEDRSRTPFSPILFVRIESPC